MTHEEAAEVLRIPVGTVKTHISRGKEKLRAFCKKALNLNLFNIMTNSSNNDWLDDLLKEEPAYIDDAGFTATVVTRLPARSNALWQRRIILGFATFCAMIAALFTLPSSEELIRWVRIAAASASNSQSLALMGMMIVATVFGSSCYFFVSREK